MKTFKVALVSDKFYPFSAGWEIVSGTDAADAKRLVRLTNPGCKVSQVLEVNE